MRAIVALAVPLIFLAGRLATVRAGESDRDRIQGEWVVSAGEKGGRKAEEGGLKEIKVTFTGDELVWYARGEETRGSFSLDPAKSPREIVMSLGGKQLAGIYRLEGDALKICVGAGEERPVEFATKEGAKTALLNLKRRKP